MAKLDGYKICVVAMMELNTCLWAPWTLEFRKMETAAYIQIPIH
jgi:hypothetical protein